MFKASTGRRRPGRKFRPVCLQPPDLATRDSQIATPLLPFSYLILASSTHTEERASQGRHECATTKHRRLALTAALSQPHASPSPSPLAITVAAAAAARRLEHWSPPQFANQVAALPPPTDRRSSSPDDLAARLAAVAVAVRRGDLSQLKKASVVAALELLVLAKLDTG